VLRVSEQPLWSSGLARVRSGTDELDAALETASRSLLGRQPDLGLVFCAGVEPELEARLVARVRDRLTPRVLCGCGASAVLGGGQELEGESAISFLVGCLPGTELRAMRVEVGGTFEAENGTFGAANEAAVRGFVLFGDPWTCDAEALIAGIEARYPGSTQVGGLGSGGRAAGETGFYLDEAIHRDGAVGVGIAGGNCLLDAVVAQGCRPVGTPLFVTRARDNWLLELDGQPAVSVLRELWDQLSERDQRLAQQALFVGIEMLPERSQYGRGDFLVRNLLGANAEGAGLAVGAKLREGQVVQFHLRDAATSAQDLAERLLHYRAALDGKGGAAEAALLCSCVGRGAALYAEPHHDSSAFRRTVGEVPLSGFFCNGEIGPVAGRTFLHAYTSAFGVFRRTRSP